jgi:hypothetical protein
MQTLRPFVACENPAGGLQNALLLLRVVVRTRPGDLPAFERTAADLEIRDSPRGVTNRQ